MTKLTVRDLHVELDHKTIVSNIDLEVAVGEWTCIIGPNGAGKSSLLKALAGIIPSTGQILIDDSNMRDLSQRDRACWIAYVAQEPVMPGGMQVFDYVLLGRTAHLKMLATESPKDLDIAHYVISELDLEKFVARDVATLSGGERQRVAIARALAQASPIILLDEPTTALDVGYQQEVLELIDRLRKEKKIAVISTMHDLTVSGLYPDRLMLLAEGNVVASGSAESVLTPENIARHYGAKVTVINHESGPVVIPERN
ncbi:MAG: ABC transporter ATP-binding protein [Candidatus Nanopelagicales bacterium]|nr:ABC transporter ATP-binding protein [Candidatus Nanopelagicales bacterium]